MSTPSPAKLLAFLQHSGFLTPDQVRELSAGIGAKFADSQALLREMVARGWLTAYQANQLGQGRGGELLLGPFRIMDRLGEGGMGQVLKAYHVNMGRVVALKIIPRSQVANATAVARFYREVRAVAQLSHPNIVTAFEVNQVGSTHYLAMEYVDGIDLARLVQQSGPLPIPSACEYVRQVALGLQHAHEKGLIHRDIKPGNLMVTRPDPNVSPVVKILDFGLARLESESTRKTRLTQLGHIVGTVDYIAPEQVENPRTADIRADIYSLGCSLFYLLTGKPPFSGDDADERLSARLFEDAPSVRRSRSEVSPALDLILKKMMSRDPAGRYQTPGEVARVLESHTSCPAEVATPAPALVPRLPPAETDRATQQPKSKRGPRRRGVAPLQRWLTGVLVLVVMIGVGVIVLVNWPAASPVQPPVKDTTPGPTQAVLPRPEVGDQDPAGQRQPPPLKPEVGGHHPAGQVQPPIPKPEGLAKTFTNSVGMEFVLVLSGEFLMGSPPTEESRGIDEGPQRTVKITGFYCGKFEVTRAQFRQFVAATGYQTKAEQNSQGGFGYDTASKTFRMAKKFNWRTPGFAQDDNHPVVMMTYPDAQAFCTWLNTKTEGKGRYGLLREAEWEYACRAGTTTRFFNGDDAEALVRVGNVVDASARKALSLGRDVRADDSYVFTAPVGKFQPNAWGLFDMHGNVWEWCQDGYDASYYSRGEDVDPRGPTRGAGHVLRGGAFSYSAQDARSSRRWPGPPHGDYSVGFRVCCRTE